MQCSNTEPQEHMYIKNTFIKHSQTGVCDSLEVYAVNSDVTGLLQSVTEGKPSSPWVLHLLTLDGTEPAATVL